MIYRIDIDNGFGAYNPACKYSDFTNEGDARAWFADVCARELKHGNAWPRRVITATLSADVGCREYKAIATREEA
jgi:hypothetical protein